MYILNCFQLQTYMALSNWIKSSSRIIEHMAVLKLDLKKKKVNVCGVYALLSSHFPLAHHWGADIPNFLLKRKENNSFFFIHSVIRSLLVGPSHRVGFTSIGQELWWWSKVKFLRWLKTCLPTSDAFSLSVFNFFFKKGTYGSTKSLHSITSTSKTTIHHKCSTDSDKKKGGGDCFLYHHNSN